MNYRRPSSTKQHGSDEVNITPVMNLFLVLIPFLLLTAEFVRIAILELNLPSTAVEQQANDQKNNDKPLVLIMVRIEENGFHIRAPRMKNDPIPVKNSAYQFEMLARELNKIKSRYQSTEEITIQPTDNVLYDVIVHVMDTCRENGFPKVSLSG